MTFFPSLYERLGRLPFSIPPPVVDQMEMWQVVAVLGAWRESEPVALAAGSRVAPGQKVDDRALIRARLAAHARGEPEPLHLFGDVDQ